MGEQVLDIAKAILAAHDQEIGCRYNNGPGKDPGRNC